MEGVGPHTALLSGIYEIFFLDIQFNFRRGVLIWFENGLGSNSVALIQN
jgi:hypothetical protein